MVFHFPCCNQLGWLLMVGGSLWINDLSEWMNYAHCGHNWFTHITDGPPPQLNLSNVGSTQQVKGLMMTKYVKWSKSLGVLNHLPPLYNLHWFENSGSLSEEGQVMELQYFCPTRPHVRQYQETGLRNGCGSRLWLCLNCSQALNIQRGTGKDVFYDR